MTTFIEVPATKQSISNRKPIYGVGINDADYAVKPIISGKQQLCPYYKVWKSMICRAFSAKYQDEYPTYAECSVVDEWIRFSVFKEWMLTQNWEGKHLDKDILINGNKVYGPDSCVFVSPSINNLMSSCEARRGLCPKGVSFNKASGMYVSYCNDHKIRKHLGYFDTANKAENAYLLFKSGVIRKIANEHEASKNKKLKDALLIHSDLLLIKANSMVIS